jgi:PleD family two-component response regulator
VTVSAGVAHSRPEMSGEELLAAADRALYRAKAGGGNAVAR